MHFLSMKLNEFVIIGQFPLHTALNIKKTSFLQGPCCVH